MSAFFFSPLSFNCPTGYYLDSLHLPLIWCCRPQNHTNAYERCHDGDTKFDKGHAECQTPGYYITDYAYPGKFECCKMMMKGNSILLDSHLDQESAAM